MRVRTLDPLTDPEWSALVAARRGGLFHSPPWLGAIKDTYQFRLQAAVTIGEDGCPVAGVPYAVLEGPPAPRVVVAPFCDACDPLFERPADWEALLATLAAFQLPLHFRCLDSVVPTANFTVTKRARWQSVELAGTSEAQWRAIHPSAQRGIRKARRCGVVCRPLTPGPGLAAFHRLHVGLRKSKYRLLAQPLAFIESIAWRFQMANGWHALGAWIGDRLVGGTIYLRWGDTLYYKFNASAPDALDARPNTLLTWEGLELARSLGCRHLDLGPSDDNQPGLIRFKRQFGADERELKFLRRVPEGWDDGPSVALKQMLSDLTSLLTRPEVPDPVTAAAGTILYRYFA